MTDLILTNLLEILHHTDDQGVADQLRRLIGLRVAVLTARGAA